MIPVTLVVLLSFLSGALPFSVWLGRIFLHRDVRQYGDGNPGMMNVYRAGGRLLAVAVLALDVGKGALPVGWAYHTLALRGLPMFFVAMAPVMGHAFSPFLRFRGGKALAVTLGVWIGLTIWPVPLVACAGIVCWYALLTPTGWAVLWALAGMLATILLWLPDPLFVAVVVAQAALLSWTHRAGLRQRPHLRPWVSGRRGRTDD